MKKKIEKLRATPQNDTFDNHDHVVFETDEKGNEVKKILSLRPVRIKLLDGEDIEKTNAYVIEKIAVQKSEKKIIKETRPKNVALLYCEKK